MTQRVRIGAIEDFPQGELRTVDAEGTSLIVSRDGDRFCAAQNRCPHLGFPLNRGPGGLEYADGVVQCPWHNSRFELCSGENLDWATGFAGRQVPRWSQRLVALGRKPGPLRTLPVHVEGQDVIVEL